MTYKVIVYFEGKGRITATCDTHAAVEQLISCLFSEWVFPRRDLTVWEGEMEVTSHFIPDVPDTAGYPDLTVRLTGESI